MSKDTDAPLLVFADDWGRHPSSCQHLIRELLPRRQVLWVNTIGTRPPRLDLRTMQRVAEKVGQWVRPGLGTSPLPHAVGATGPDVLAPRMWPSFATPFARRLNRRMLVDALRPAINRLSSPPIVVTTLPIVADLVDVLPVARWVYYCVDDFGVWPGYDGETMRRMERELVPKVDTTIAASDTLADGLRALGATPRVLTHGVDLEFWSAPSLARSAPELVGLEPPFVVFWGVIDRRMDVEWIAALGRAMDRGTIVLLGPREDPGPALFGLPRVAALPPAAFARLPAIAAAASVLIMPYVDAPVTRAMQPLKLKEYLATGTPAVVRSLPATMPWADACDVCTAADRFVRTVLERNEGGLPPSQASARQRLRDESWARKATLFDRWIGMQTFTRAAARSQANGLKSWAG